MKKSIKSLLMGISFTFLISYSAKAATYNVVSGDTLYKLSSLFNTSINTIMKNNNLSSSQIYPNQKLNIPSDTYTVKSGDSLYLIAKKYNISIYSIQLANHQWSTTLYPGQLLILPGVVNGVVQNSSTTKTPIVPYTASDLDLLSRLVHAEAMNQPYAAKVGVAAVVLNRVQNSQFPKTISDVIYEKSYGYYQFTPVLNGWINKPSDAECTQAAYDALYGADPTKDALFYFDDSATSTWLWSKPISIQIGRMVFAY